MIIIIIRSEVLLEDNYLYFELRLAHEYAKITQISSALFGRKFSFLYLTETENLYHQLGSSNCPLGEDKNKSIVSGMYIND